MKTHVSSCNGHMFEDLSIFSPLNKIINKYPERLLYFVELSFTSARVQVHWVKILAISLSPFMNVAHMDCDFFVCNGGCK